MPKRYKTGMVFGVYDVIEDRHAKLLLQANMLCDNVLVAVSSDEELFLLTKKPSTMPLSQRAQNVREYCNREKILATIIAIPGKHPSDIVREHPVDAYILSTSQYERFGKELETLRTKHHLLGKIITA